ncbi:unnamed protein product [Bursaphelenchus okinawaensis]|uniref:Cap-specific mRNA (nucleoside-2'-O-)-methyltransferase 2 n=1 Tax=Bursaphelenchus okinawaensis TaxID=465554 RepID=A0A811LJJ1_9BILA|nr:unnamed protein product [Bursaphelenchus okinawaensis]CAG9124323.1 unnamed protein product [Bursaphelenchus okinawaensis]
MTTRDLAAQYDILCDNLFKKYYVLKNRDYVLRHVDLNHYGSDEDSEEAKLRAVQEKISLKISHITQALWHGHTTFTHPMKLLPSKIFDEYPKLKGTITQAYCKFIEILQANPELTKSHVEMGEQQFRTLHLCEAPGNFVRALGDYLPESQYENWTWRMNSLNPYYEAADLRQIIYDDNFMIRHMDKMVFGTDNTGNVAMFSDDYVGNLVGETGKFHLITCDGSFDCREYPGEQERVTSNLFKQCWRAANKCLQRNGCFVMKIYTFFTDEMQNLLTQISTCFQRVVFQKPACSKPGNSEVYLICIGFDEAMVNSVVDLAGRVLPALKSASNFFSAHQRDMIHFNLKSYAKFSPRERIALVIKKTNLIAEEMHKNFGFLAKTEERRAKYAAYPKVILNPWLKTAWSIVNLTDHNLEDYFAGLHPSGKFPLTAQLNDDTIPSMDQLLERIQKVECTARHPFVTVSHRCTRTPFPEFSPLIHSSMFADFSLLEWARDHKVPYYDLTYNNKNMFRRLRHELVYECDGVYVDSPFMVKNAWMELCAVVAYGSPVGCEYPRRHHLVQLIDDEHPHLIDRVHIYMVYGEQMVLTRFAASVIFFLAQFFEKVAFDKNGIHFLHRKLISHELATYMGEVSIGLPDSYDLLQFVPSLLFATPQLYDQLLEYNNTSLMHSLRKEPDNRVEEQ